MDIRYKKFKKDLLKSDYVASVEKKGKYIYIYSNQCYNFEYLNLLDYVATDLYKEGLIETDYFYYEEIKQKYGLNLKYIWTCHFNTLIYYSVYKIVE